MSSFKIPDAFPGRSLSATPLARSVSGPLIMSQEGGFDASETNAREDSKLPWSGIIQKSEPLRHPSDVGEMMKRVRTLSFGGSTRSMSVDLNEPEASIGDDHDAELAEMDVITRPPLALIVLEFRDLSYDVHLQQKFSDTVKELVASRGRNSVNPADTPTNSRRKRTRQILNKISGEARDGEILAVMGHSGSGKSTLIDALAQRIAPESLGGTITLNGEQVSSTLLRSISAYVMQDDLLFPMLTVKETLTFAAEVRLPSSTHDAERRRDRVGQLLIQLGLQGAADTIIGDEEIRGVSGGERRRVSIGIDIIHDPLLLFLDEPTSGLDSTSAYMIVKTLRKIALSGSIVILSIHQPSYRILGLLDRLLILASGQKVYGGAPSELKPFFEAFGRPIPEHENSTEHALDLIQEFQRSPGGINHLIEFAEAWEEGVAHEAEAGVRPGGLGFQDAINARRTRGKLVDAVAVGVGAGFDEMADLVKLESRSSVVDKFANSFFHEVWALLWRSLVNIRRTPQLFYTRLGTVIMTGLIVATFFWQLGHKPKTVQQRLGLFTFFVAACYFLCADALPVFLQERHILLRETAHNAYRKSSYVVAHSLVYIPFQAILAIVFVSTIWWGVGLAGGPEGFGFLFILVWAAFWSATAFITFLSAIIPHYLQGYIILVATLSYFQLVAGFFITRRSIPDYWIWLHYISLIKYPYESIMINEFDRPGTCFIRGSEILAGTPLEAVSNPAIIDQMLGVIRQVLSLPYDALNSNTCILTGHDVLVSQDIVMTKWFDLGITVLTGFIFRILFYIVLRVRGQRKRR
ncbi:hypothetical protein R1sor_009351 [Riccia sorocarpa]|uniref:ABC transporter domain-containing protein n=1 Tax=Riccia sorocarpa TaxID=122646 RepID=A0ABD3HYD2_9MARC